ncbi:MAG: hypothetical protein ACK56I_33295, partial [bacterium]
RAPASPIRRRDRHVPVRCSCGVAQCLDDHRDCSGDILVRVRRADKSCLELRGGKIHAVLQTVMKKFRELRGVGFFGLFKIAHGTRGEEETEHAAVAVEGAAGLGCGIA